MDTEMRNAVQAIDAKVQETEQLIVEAKHAAAMMPVLLRRLDSLRKTRALLTGDEAELASLENVGPAGVNGKPRHGSIGHRLTLILAAAGKPLEMRDIHRQLQSQDVEIGETSVAAILSTYVKRGWIARTGIGCYSTPPTEHQE